MESRVKKETELLLDAFLDPFRLEVIELLLSHGKLYPGQIANMLNEDKSKVVYHLRILEKACLVESRYEIIEPHSSPAKFVKFYYVNRDKLREALNLLAKYRILEEISKR